MKTSTLTIALLKLVLIFHRVQSEDFKSSHINYLKRDTVVRNYDNITRIEEILELFSVDVIGSQWTKIHDKLSTVCAQNMMEYLSGLERKEIWAIKSKLFERLPARYLWLIVNETTAKRNWKRTAIPDLYGNFTFHSSQVEVE